MKRRLAVLIGLIASLAPTYALADTPSGDGSFCIQEPLIGYGLVIGLKDTGDNFQKSPMTLASLKRSLARSGDGIFNPSPYQGTVAAVLVFARMDVCKRPDGSVDTKVDRSVDLKLTAVGDASSLQGGTLLTTPLLGADGQVYALGKGALAPCTIPAVSVSACIADGGLVVR